MKRERAPTSTTDLHRMGEQFLLGLDGKVLDPRITDVLYDNPFALDEMAKGNLAIYKIIIEGKVKDYVVYNPLKDVIEAQQASSH
jgi:hypothetical protein